MKNSGSSIELINRDVIDVREHFEAGQVLNVCKPAGWTSFDVVKKVRRLTGVRKVGHCGTLDPFATGVLLIVTGKYTRRSSEFMAFEKTYEADFEFGKETDTLDPTGRLTEESQLPAFSQTEVERALEGFLGVIDQVPPRFSAVKRAGTRAYKLARQGKEPQLEPRQVEVHSFDLLNFEPPVLTFLIKCSKGTYVRALARDLARSLGTFGYVKRLVRTSIGAFTLEDSLSIAELEASLDPQASISGQ